MRRAIRFAVAFEENQPNVAPLADQDIAIGALERRAGDDAVIASLAGGVDPGGDGVQPGPAVLIVQRLAVMHLLDVRLRMKPVAVLIGPMQAMREHRRDGAFAGAGNAHHHDDGRNFRWRLHDAVLRRRGAVDQPDQIRRRNGRGCPADPRRATRGCRISRLPAPSTRNSISRVEASAGNVKRDARHERLHAGLGRRRAPSGSFRRAHASPETARRCGRRGRAPSARGRTTAAPDRADPRRKSS